MVACNRHRNCKTEHGKLGLLDLNLLTYFCQPFPFWHELLAGSAPWCEKVHHPELFACFPINFRPKSLRRQLNHRRIHAILIETKGTKSFYIKKIGWRWWQRDINDVSSGASWTIPRWTQRCSERYGDPRINSVWCCCRELLWDTNGCCTCCKAVHVSCSLPWQIELAPDPENKSRILYHNFNPTSETFTYFFPKGMVPGFSRLCEIPATIAYRVDTKERKSQWTTE